MNIFLIFSFFNRHENNFLFPVKLSFHFSGCNKTLTDLSGIVESSSYPNYPNNLLCAWQIKASTDERISLVFQYFDLEYSTNCSRDSLEVWEQWNTPNEKFIGKFCGYLLGKWLQSNGSSLYIRFKTDSKTIRRGFRLKYSVVKSGTFVFQ